MLDIRRTLEPAANTSGVHLQVAGSDVVPLNKRPLFVDDLVYAEVGVEVGFDVLEEHYGAVCASATVYDTPMSNGRCKAIEHLPEFALSSELGGERDSIVESTERRSGGAGFSGLYYLQT